MEVHRTFMISFKHQICLHFLYRYFNNNKNNSNLRQRQKWNFCTFTPSPQILLSCLHSSLYLFSIHSIIFPKTPSFAVCLLNNSLNIHSFILLFKSVPTNTKHFCFSLTFSIQFIIKFQFWSNHWIIIIALWV